MVKEEAKGSQVWAATEQNPVCYDRLVLDVSRNFLHTEEPAWMVPGAPRKSRMSHAGDTRSQHNPTALMSKTGWTRHAADAAAEHPCGGEKKNQKNPKKTEVGIEQRNSPRYLKIGSKTYIWARLEGVPAQRP